MTKEILLLIVLSIAAPVHADISDSGNLTIGGQGVIVGTMTVQGNAFSVAGATFSVAGGSITLGGRLNAAAAGIKWADGTTSTTAASGAAVAVTTFTRITGSVTTSGLTWLTVAGATVTMIMNGGRADMRFYCSIASSSSGGPCHTGFLVNGGLIDGETASLGFGHAVAQDNGNQKAGSAGGGDGWAHVTESTYTGSTTFAPIFKSGSSGGYTCYVNDSLTILDPNREMVCQFVVTEVRN